MFRNVLYFLLLMLVLSACRDPNEDLTDIEYNPQIYNLELPESLQEIIPPIGDKLTYDGINLGRHLFYDPILSSDGSMSCSSCHFPESAFTDNKAVSIGVDGIAGARSSMSLVNSLFFTNGLFWDGRSQTLEDQALLPVEDPIELHESWPNVVEKFKESEIYPSLFRKAFGIKKKSEITRDLAAQALAQFESILISGDAPYDKFKQLTGVISDEAHMGLKLFFDEPSELPDAECNHCHSGGLFTSNEYMNNGIDTVLTLDEFVDKGRYEATGNPFHQGTFRVPSLRNIELTAPYMHDGRFATLEEVVEHYNDGGHLATNSDPNVRKLDLTDEHKAALVEFMKSLTDTTYLENPLVQNPF